MPVQDQEADEQEVEENTEEGMKLVEVSDHSDDADVQKESDEKENDNIPTEEEDLSEENDSEPVEGAVVSVAEKTATTDDSGVATITDVLDDTYEVVVECEGYETSTSSITVDETHTSFTILLEEASEQQEET